MKKSLNALLIGLIVISGFGCASEHRLAKPKGKWIAVNQPEQTANKAVNTQSKSTINSN